MEPPRRVIRNTARVLGEATGTTLSAALDRAQQIIERATLRPTSGTVAQMGRQRGWEEAVIALDPTPEEVAVLRDALVARAARRPVEQLATTVFVLGKHPREPALVDLAAALLREHVEGGDPDVLYQALIALENWGEDFGVSSWAHFEVDENRRRARAWLRRYSDGGSGSGGSGVPGSSS